MEVWTRSPVDKEKRVRLVEWQTTLTENGKDRPRLGEIEIGGAPQERRGIIL